MPDLNDGESAHVQGSARLPYILKNVGGVYSCTCPAWRNQSLPIERRTCKHLRTFRGEQAEQERLGARLSKSSAATPSTARTVPNLLLAERWENDIDLAGWWMSEKLDGVRAWWTGREFLSRQGNVYCAPDWFVAGLPSLPLDGELWLDRKTFQRTVSIVRRHDQSEHWRRIAFVVFDAPAANGPFESRQAFLDATLREHRPQYARVLQQERCTGIAHLQTELARVETLGGEGLMLRQPESRYEPGRSSTLLKVKTFHDAEARVVEHLPGRGRHAGRLGAVVAELPSGLTFSVGTGFTDAERQNPPPVGSLITFRYQELTDRGVPRFPSFVRGWIEDDTSAVALTALAPDAQQPGVPAVGDHISIDNTNNLKESIMDKRYFEFIGGNSAKFWEIGVSGNTVTVRFGRIGTDGQTQVKPFPDADAATRHAEKLIAAKIGKGYAEAVAR